MKILYSIILLLLTLSFVPAEEFATYYIRDANGNVIAEYDQDGNLKHINIYGLDLIGRFEPSAQIVLMKDGAEIGRYISLEAALEGIANDGGASGDYEMTAVSTEQVVLNDVNYSFNANVQSVTISGDDVVIDGESELKISN